MPIEPDVQLRLATPADAAGCLAIYAPIVRHESTSFEITPPDELEFANRIATTLTRCPWLVAVTASGDIRGYAYADLLRQRAAYRWSVEVSAYIAADQRRTGLGRRLYTELFTRLRAQGYCQVFAGVTLPNDASVRFHESLGFAALGVYRDIGCKFGRWHSVGWWQKRLVDPLPTDPPPPVPPLPPLP